MAKIHFVYPDGTEARFALEGHSFTIGRDANNDIVIPDPRVSSSHLVLKRSQSGNFIVQDLGATNPTRINGRVSALAELSDGDTLMLGDTYARYEGPPAAGTPHRRPPGRPRGRTEDPAGDPPASSGCFALFLITSLSLTLAGAAGAAGVIWAARAAF
jgi:hypothetical protein